MHVAVLRFPVVLAALALPLLAARAAHASWTVPQQLAGANVSSLRAAGNARGQEAFVWRITSNRRLVKVGNQTGNPSYVRARLRSAGGRLTTTETISRTDRLVAGPAIGLDRAGNATAVWVQAGESRTLMVAVRRSGERFGRAFAVGRSGSFNDAVPQIAVAPDGAAVIAWNSGAGGVQVVRRPAGRCAPSRRARGCFGAVQRLPVGSDQTVAVGPAGGAYLVWAAGVRRGREYRTELRMAIAPRRGRFAMPRTLSRTGDSSQPAIAVGADGGAVIAWRGSLPAGGEQDVGAIIQTVTRDRRGRISGAQMLSAAPGKNPQVVVNDQGEAIIAWNQFRSAPQAPDSPKVAYAVRPAGAATFGPRTVISAAGATAGSASLAVDAAGNAFLAYSASPPGVRDPVGVSHVRPPGGAFGAPFALPADFTGAFLVAAGARIGAASGGSGGRTLLAHWSDP